MGFEIGEHVGDYRITGVLGAGGYGEVYRAEHTITKRLEALKILAPDRPHSADEEQRFLREIQLHASLAHPNIASVYNAFSTRRGLVLAMELVEGESLEALLRRGRVPLETGLDYILQALSALGHAHANAVLHRDVKPGNIVVAPAGTVKLTDFGLARQTEHSALTQSGTPAGSPYYMSPEQIHGVGLVDARSDLYSTGAVLYEVVTGVRPFEGESAFEVMQAHVERAPLAPMAIQPAIRPALNQVILTALAKEPSGRFQSAAEFRDALEAARRDLKLAAPNRGPRSRRAFALPAKTVWAAAAALALGAVILAGVMRSGGQAPAPVAPQAPAKPEPIAVQPASPVPEPPLPVANEQSQPVAETPALEPSTASEVSETAPSPAPKQAARTIRRTRAAAEPRREPIPVEQPAAARAEEPPPADVSAPSPQPVTTAAEVSAREPVEDLPASPPEEPEAEAAPKKRGNRVWRALGRIARPWRSSKKPETEAPEPQPQ